MNKDTRNNPTSVYRYRDVLGVLIYVGITGRGIARNIEHNKSKDWWRYVASQEVTHCATRAEALRLEREWIKKHRPPFNVQHNADADELRAAYEAVFPDPDNEPAVVADRRKWLPLMPIPPLNEKSAVALRTRIQDADMTASIVAGPNPNTPVCTPEGQHAGNVVSLTTRGLLRVLQVRLKNSPPAIVTARAVLKRLPDDNTRFRVSKVVINDPDDITNWGAFDAA